MFRVDDNKISKKFLFYLLNQDRFEQECIKSASGIAQKNLSTLWLLKHKIPLPPLEIQQEIVAEVDSYHKIIGGAKQIVKNYKPIFKVDSGWKTIRLGEVCDFRNGINYTKDGSGEKIKILGVKDFQDNFYMSTKDLAYIMVDGIVNGNDLLNDGDIVFVRSNGNQKLIGRCLLIGNVGERITHSGFTIRLILKNKEINPAFLVQLLKMDMYRQKMAEGGTGANIKSLTQGILSNLVVPIPPLEVQNQVVSQLEQEQKLIKSTKNSLRFSSKK